MLEIFTVFYVHPFKLLKLIFTLLKIIVKFLNSNKKSYYILKKFRRFNKLKQTLLA